jgi:hypothetical protein
MTLWDVQELCDYWAENPPVHLLVAGFVGYKGSEHSSSVPSQSRQPQLTAAEMARMARDMGMTPGTLDGYPAVIFDAEELMNLRPN